MTPAVTRRAHTCPSRSTGSRRSSATSRTTGSASTAWPPASRPTPSHPDLPRFRDQPRECAGGLARVGARANAAGIRLSTHPGQYTVLNSEDPRVAGLAVDELEVQAVILDGMGLGSEAVVVLHVGG